MDPVPPAAARQGRFVSAAMAGTAPLGGPRWWRTEEALDEERAVQDPHPRNKWARNAEASVLAWAGDAAYSNTVDHSGWAARRESFVSWCEVSLL